MTSDSLHGFYCGVLFSNIRNSVGLSVTTFLVHQFTYRLCWGKLVQSFFELLRNALKILCTSSRSQFFFKIGVLKTFAIFTGKDLCWSKRFWCFLMNIAKFLRTIFSENTSGGCFWLWKNYGIFILRWWSGWRGYFRSMFSLVPPENIGKSLFDVFRGYRKRTLIGLKLVKYGHDRGENKIVKWDNRD